MMERSKSRKRSWSIWPLLEVTSVRLVAVPKAKGDFKTEALNELLESDVKDLQSKGTDVESIRIDDD
jgi:hypothetical protein